jgi:hypothetical protein
MPLSRRRRLLALAALVPAVLVLVPAGSAQAAVPVAGISYSGTSAHGFYTLVSATSCVANDTDVSAVCVQPAYLNLTVTPTPKEGPKCNAYGGVSMGYIPLKPDGAFTYDAFNADNYHIIITGHFTTSRTVVGSIKNIGFGCPSDTFAITIPPPVSPLSPCEMLIKVHAIKVIGGGLPGVIEENTFTATEGECMVPVGRINDLELVVSTSRTTLPIGIGGMASKGLAGPGPGATLYAAANGNFFQAVVVFHHGPSWAALSYDYQHSPCPASTHAGTSCVPKSAQSSITAHVESSAHQVYALL